MDRNIAYLTSLRSGHIRDGDSRYYNVVHGQALTGTGYRGEEPVYYEVMNGTTTVVTDSDSDDGYEHPC